MAVLGDAIYDLLKGIETDVYPHVAPEGNINTPFVVYSIISCIPTDTKDGVSELDSYRVQFSIYHNDDRNLDILANTIRTAIDRVSGTYKGIAIRSIQFDTEWGDYDSAAKLHFRIQDYKIDVKK